MNPALKFLNKTKYFLLLFIFANILFFTANIPFFKRAYSVPPGNTPTWQHQAVVMDYLGYIEIIRESGEEGAWEFKDLYTFEPTSATRNMFYFILLGKIVSLTHLSPTAVYHAARLIQFEIFILVLAQLCRLLLGVRSGFWATALSLIISPPAQVFTKTIYGVGDTGIPAWWMLQPFRAVDMLPHHGASAILLLLTIICLIKSFSGKSVKMAVLSAVAGFFSIIFHPVSALFIGIGLPLAAAVITTRESVKTRRINLKYAPNFIIPIVLGALAVGIIRYDIVTSPTFSNWLYFDVVWYDRYTGYVRDYLLSGFPLFLLLIPVIIYNFIKGKPAEVLISVWAVLSYLLIPISTQIGVAKFRFALLLPFIPQAIIAVGLLDRLFRSGLNRTVKFGALGIILIIIIGIYLPSMPVMYRTWAREYGAQEAGMYYSSDWLSALTYLKNHAPKYARIFTGETNGIMIPAYTPAVTYAGQYSQTYDFEAKKTLVREFFSGYLPESDALKLLGDNRVNYVFVSPEEKSWGPGPLVNFPVFYQNDTITIYAVD
jgi:hypothetical protein